MNDYLIDPTTLDDLVRDGDRAIGDVTVQNQNLLLRTNKGEWKATPDVGVGLFSFIGDEGSDDLMREIRRQCVKDGMQVNNIQVSAAGKLTIDATY